MLNEGFSFSFLSKAWLISLIDYLKNLCNCLCDRRSTETFKWALVEKSQILSQDTGIK